MLLGRHLRTSSTRNALPATAFALAIGSITIAAIPAGAAVVGTPVYDQAAASTVKLDVLGSYDTGIFDQSAAEIVAFHAATNRLLTVNAESGQINVIDASDPTELSLIGSVSGGANTTINSVAVRADGLAVATVEPDADKTLPGELIFFDAGAEDLGEVLGRVTVGSLPDMVALTEDGAYALVANEGEPAEDYSVDPEGSISVVTLPSAVAAASQGDVRTAGFDAFEGHLAAKGVHIFGQVGASTTEAQNLEPEYIATADGKAYITLQENNAVAVVDIATATVEDVFPLGYIDRIEVALDASDKDGTINLQNWPVKSMLRPDSIAAYTAGGTTYLVLANEGDARDWDAYSEEARIKDFGNAKKGVPALCDGFAGMTAEEIADFQSDDNAGRLNATTSRGFNEELGCYEEIYVYGGRSFSIYTADGQRIFDSGSEFEEITAEVLPEFFNSNHTETSFDTRSDDKGPEPEGVAVGEVNGRTYAFIGFERVGGVIVYDITDPAAPVYQAYINNRDFSVNVKEVAATGDPAAITAGLEQAGDLGAEGLAFIPAEDSPTGTAMLAVGNEVSGTTTLFKVQSLLDASPTTPASSISHSAAAAGSSASSDGSSAAAGIFGILAVLLGAAAAVAGFAFYQGLLPAQLVEAISSFQLHTLI
ncbi:choice-of-anchor I family protein [Corynebacterium sp.]|uniref:choice-of-anchor I family protein n=1 Tax=Corynebacterium sp. TaxID=1720 RepID=UPI002A919E8F|nr:choice-of-anchor I family protein [Corynebacterium sp.]MDY5786539.1 choice-of-anchor I family protein [Corynebacterium sp.]